MSDVNANINISIDSSQALAQLRSLQNQISSFNKSVVAGNAAAAAAQRDLNRNLAVQINASKQFTTSIASVESSVSRLGRSIDKGKLSLGEYFRYGTAASGTFGKAMKENAEIMALAESRAKRLQTQYVALGEAQNGYTKAMAIRPNNVFNADAAISIQRQQLFNKLLNDGSTSLINWGKNTQWAGRQLMVGFTVPLTIFGGVASQVFMDLEKQIVQFKRVYGDLGTMKSETDAMIKEIQRLGSEFTKYGISVSDTIALAADAAAAGYEGADLIAQTTEATRLATLGQIDYQQALDATVTLQSAFGTAAEDMAESTNFLNAVENQTVLSLDDVTQSIPIVATVIKGLGGDVKDLAVLLTAMREGGVNANEGANALKTSLARLISPTRAASERAKEFGINLKGIVEGNEGNLMGMIMDLEKAMRGLSNLERQKFLSDLFGKRQFARMGALFGNIAKEGSQAQRVLDLTAMSAEDLGQIAEGELSKLEESVGVKFTGAVEKLKLAIAPIGEAFLKIATPIIEFATKVADKFNSLPDAAKTFITWAAAIGGVLVPTLVMLVGLFGNFAGQIIKLGLNFGRIIGKTQGAGHSLDYLTEAELDAMAAAASLEGQTNGLTAALNVQKSAVIGLARSYGRYVAAAQTAAANVPQGFRGKPMRGMATGGFVGGTGNKDSEPALLMPGEFVVNKKAAEQYGPILSAMNEGKIVGYAEGTKSSKGKQSSKRANALEYAHVADRIELSMDQMIALARKLEEAGQTSSKAYRMLDNAIKNNQKVFGYSNLGIPMAGDVNVDLGKSGASKSRVLSSIERTGAGTAAGVIDIFQQKGVMDDATAKQFGESFHKAFAAEIKNLPNEVLKDADLTVPFERAVKSAASEISEEFAQTATQIINEEKAAITTIVDKEAQVHGGSGRAPITGKVSGATTSYSSRRTQRGRMYASLTGASAQGAGTASPSIITEQQGKDIAKGMEQGIEKGTPAVVDAAENMGRAAVNGSEQGVQSGRKGRRGAYRPQGPADAYTAQGQRILPKGFDPKPVASTQTKFEKVVSDSTKSVGMVAKESDKTVSSLRNFGSSLKASSGKMMGTMFALDGLIFGLSMVNGGIGEFAQSIMPALFAIQSLPMMMGALGGPVTIAIAAIAAVGFGLWKVNDNMNELRQRGRDLADAMTNSTKAMNDTAGFFGNELVGQKQAAQAAGLSTEELTQGQEYLQTEIGKSMVSGFSEGMTQMGTDRAVGQFASKLGSMIMQGAVTPEQARAISSALEKEIGATGIAAKINGKLESLVGEDGKDIRKHPMIVAVKLQAQNTEFINSVTNSVEDLMSQPSIQNVMNLQSATQGLVFGGGLSGMVANTSASKDIPILSGIARNVRSFFDPEWAAMTTALNTYGVAVSNVANQNYGDLNAAQERLNALRRKAEKTEDPQKKEKINKQIKEQSRLVNVIKESMEELDRTAQKTFDTFDTGFQAETLGSLEQSLADQFTGSGQEGALANVLSLIGGQDNSIKFNIETTLASGQLSPSVVSGFLSEFENKDAAVKTLNLAINSGEISELNKQLVKIMSISDDTLRKQAILEMTVVTSGERGLETEEQKTLREAAGKERSRVEDDPEFKSLRDDIYWLNEDKRRVLADLDDAKARLANAESETDKQLIRAEIESLKTQAKEWQRQIDEKQSRVNTLMEKANKAQRDYEKSTRTGTVEGTRRRGRSAAMEFTGGDAKQRSKEAIQTLGLIDEINNKGGNIDVNVNVMGKKELEETQTILSKINKLDPKTVKKIDVDTLVAQKNMKIWQTNWKKIKTEEDLRKEIFAGDNFTPAFKAFGTNYNEFMALPDAYKSLVAIYTTAYLTLDKQYNDANALWKDRTMLGSDRALGNRAATSAGIARDEVASIGEGVVDTAPKTKTPKTKTTETPEDVGGGGGGGTDPVKEILDGIKNQMKLYLDMERYATALKDAKGKVKSALMQTVYENSLVDQLRKKGISELMVAEIISKGPEAVQKFLNMGRKSLQQINAKKLAGTRGEIVSGYVGKERISKAGSAAIDKLKDSGLTQEDIDRIVSDETEAQVVAGLKKGSAAWNEYIQSVKDASAASEEFAEKQDPIAYKLNAIETAFDTVGNYMDASFQKEFNAIERNHRASINNYEDQIENQQDIIDGIEKEIEAINKLNDADDRVIRSKERENELLSRKIEQLDRQNELDQRRIDDLKREDDLRMRVADALQHDLEIMSRTEEKVRDTYQKRISALDKVASLNERILQSQQDQLNISKAFSEGDVYAAAAAAAAAQRNQVQYSAQANKDALQEAMENQIAGLRTSEGLTRDQAEAQIQAIQDQSYQTSLMIRDIEDQIYNRNQQMIPIKDQQYQIEKSIQEIKDRIYERESQIQDIQVSRLEPAQAELKTAQEKLKAEQDSVQAQKDSARIAGLSYEQWQDIKTQVNDTLEQQKALNDLMRTALPGVQKYANAWVEVGKTIAAANKAIKEKETVFTFSPEIDTNVADFTVPSLENMGAADWEQELNDVLRQIQSASSAAQSAGQAVSGYARGGVVRKYAAGGLLSGNGASDSLLSRLTPGEFVVRRSMVSKYGTAMLDKINQGSYPTYSTDGPRASISGGGSNANINAPVYNSYSISVPVTQPNASADEIAYKVMTKIKNIDNASIRRVNGY